ncbi:MAG: hypothetical protein JWN60_2058 [Acidobacteria bacterium]|jgi:hypothetical protein|nr:hypothetical protein [Acidobacteriota bacterium]
MWAHLFAEIIAEILSFITAKLFTRKKRKEEKSQISIKD